MTREETRAAIEVMQAWLDGKEIQFRHRPGTTWHDHQSDVGSSWDWKAKEFRIKPQPELRPWTLDEVPMGAVVRPRNGGRRRILLTMAWVGSDGVMVSGDGEHFSADHLLKELTMDDGSPCGKVVEDK